MGLFRSNGGRISWLAIFALACQLVLTFGHIHIGNVSVASPALTLLADLANGAAGPPNSPQPKSPASIAPDFCAVCSSMGLAYTLLLPKSPVVLPPNSSIQRLSWWVATTTRAPRDHIYFDARGPPQV